MDLQRPDSYQGGAGPDFNEHVLHKVKKKKNLLPVPILGEDATTTGSSLCTTDFALGFKLKLARVSYPGGDPFCLIPFAAA
jgi:hypothetical protein